MSTKDFNKLNTFKKNQDNKNKKLDILNQKGQNILQICKGKRKRSPKNKILCCSQCKKENNFDIYRFKNKKDLIKTMEKLDNNNNEINKQIQSIQKISGKFKKSIIICKKCLQEVIVDEDCVNIIKRLFFCCKERNKGEQMPICIKNSNLDINFNENSVENKKYLVKKKLNKFEDNYIKEYDECLKNIIQCLKLAVLEVSFFVRSFNIYINNNNIISINNLNVIYFFDCYLHAKIILENLYLLFNNILVKFQQITNKIIISLNSYLLRFNEELKNNYGKFIYNTNLILANLLNLVNNYRILLNVLRCSNNLDDLGK